jgi:predicted small metal-binding protein
MPEVLFLGIAKKKDELEKQIKDNLNKIHNIRDEFIENVFLEMEILDGHDWRKESGKLLAGKRIVLPDAVDRIWGNEGYRLFLSHKAEVKEETAELKEKLQVFGITGFVAHDDIRPSEEWQNEIENALFSMDAFVALITKDFHDSEWTDQEVGFAFGRGVPVISIRLGKDPYGFLGKFQAITCSWEAAAKEIAEILMPQNRMLNAYINAIRDCHNYDGANILSELLPFIKRISGRQAVNLIAAFNENGQVRDSFGFNGKSPYRFGGGLIPYLSRLTGKTYQLSKSGKIEEVI